MTAVRARAVAVEPADADLELTSEFFVNEAPAFEAFEAFELDEARDNPVLSPAQLRRRHQLRRQVTALMAGLALFALLAPWLRLA